MVVYFAGLICAFAYDWILSRTISSIIVLKDHFQCNENLLYVIMKPVFNRNIIFISHLSLCRVWLITWFNNIVATGAMIFAVGINVTFEDELRGVASSQENFIHVDGFDYLQDQPAVLQKRFLGCKFN